MGLKQGSIRPWGDSALVSQILFIKLFCRSQFPHKSVNYFFMTVIIKNTLANLCGNRLWKNVAVNAFCETSAMEVVD